MFVTFFLCGLSKLILQICRCLHDNAVLKRQTYLRISQKTPSPLEFLERRLTVVDEHKIGRNIDLRKLWRTYTAASGIGDPLFDQ